MPRWFDDAAHADPHRSVPLARVAVTCIVVYCLGAALGWGMLAALVAWVLV